MSYTQYDNTSAGQPTITLIFEVHFADNISGLLVLKAGLLLVMEYFYTLELVLLLTVLSEYFTLTLSTNCRGMRVRGQMALGCQRAQLCLAEHRYC